jgi:hypothetical protein
MWRQWLAIISWCAVAVFLASQGDAQEIKSGPQRDDLLPGAFQPLNLNGEFKERQHCLVCQFRINPVALVFVRQSATVEGQDPKVNPELKKLLDMVESQVKEHYDDTGFSCFVVFVTPDAKSSVSEGKGDKNTDLIKEAKLREKLYFTLKEEAAKYTKVIWTMYPGDSLEKYRLSKEAEFTVILYARHRVMHNFTFADGALKDEGIAQVRKGIDDMLERVKKGPAVVK